jgi:hypothetical protein
VAVAAIGNYDAVSLPYHTTFAPDGNLVEAVRRERIMRTGFPWRWTNAVHESLTSESLYQSIDRDDVVFVHRQRTKTGRMRSIRRNHKIMIRMYGAGERPYWLLYYLGKSFGALNDFSSAITIFQELAATSREPEMVYNAWLYIAICNYQLGLGTDATGALVKAIQLQPGWPDAYLMMGDWALDNGQPQLAIDWLNTGRSKHRPKSYLPFNPALYLYIPLTSLAKAYLAVGDIDNAYKYAAQARSYLDTDEEFEPIYRQIMAAAKS